MIQAKFRYKFRTIKIHLGRSIFNIIHFLKYNGVLYRSYFISSAMGYIIRLSPNMVRTSIRRWAYSVSHLLPVNRRTREIVDVSTPLMLSLLLGECRHVSPLFFLGCLDA